MRGRVGSKAGGGIWPIRIPAVPKKYDRIKGGGECRCHVCW